MYEQVCVCSFVCVNKSVHVCLFLYVCECMCTFSTFMCVNVCLYLYLYD